MVEIEVERNVLEANNRLAAKLKRDFVRRRLFVINIMSSPGAGKTTLLEKTIQALAGKMNIAVIEGDVMTSRDADRIARQGVQAVQINTQGGCHLDAQMVAGAAEVLDLDSLDLLVIENVGNLVCPAEFDLGEAAKVTILSTPEGDDKPGKYPLMFRMSDVLVVNKIDLIPHLPFSLESLRADVKAIKPDLRIFELSAQTGEGLDDWLAWLHDRVGEAKAG